MSSLDSHSSLPVRPALGAVVGNETSLPGGPPQMSGQTRREEKMDEMWRWMDGWMDEGSNVPRNGAD